MKKLRLLEEKILNSYHLEKKLNSQFIYVLDKKQCLQC